MCAVTIEQLRGETYTGSDSVVEGMYEDNRAFLDEILELVRRQRLVPFVGAGFSQFHYRGWGSLLRGMAGRYPDCREELEGLLEKGEYEDAASLLQEEMGARGRGRRDVFLRAIDGEFGEGTVEDAFAEMSSERRGIPRVFRGPILTTNYDLLIERAYSEAGEVIEVAYPHVVYHRSRVEELLRSTRPSLFKLHGDVRDPDKIVITREDYDEAYGADDGGSELTRFMGSVFEGRGAVLFLGCSLGSDRTMDVLDRSAPDHVYYALVGLPEGTENPGDPFSPNLVVDGKREPGYRDMSRRLAGMNVRPIWYPHGQHDALDALLGWLEGESGPTTSQGGGKAKSGKAKSGKAKSGKVDIIPRSLYKVIGRDEEINAVVNALSGSEASIVFVIGVAGSGKTEVCRKVLRTLRANKKGLKSSIIYISVAEVKSAWAQCNAISDALNISRYPQSEGVGASDYATYLSEVILKYERPILYLDNWEDAWNDSAETGRYALLKMLSTFRDAGIHVLVSSREDVAEYEFDVDYVEICGLKAPYDKILFEKVFKKKRGSLKLSSPSVSKLLAQFDGHPLTIVLGATLAAKSRSWSDVLKRWSGAQQKTEGHRHDNLSTALRMSWGAVSGTPIANKLWVVMALTPGDLDESEVIKLSEISGEGRGPWLRAFARLRGASLISSRNNGDITMLRPVREVSLPQIVNGEIIDWGLANDELKNECLDLLEERLIKILKEGDTGSGEARRRSLSHLPRALFLLSRALLLRGGPGEKETELAYCLANYYQRDWESSRPVLDELLALTRPACNSKLNAFAAYMRGRCSLFFGDLSDAEELLNEAERLYENSDNIIGRANVLQDHSILARRQGDLDAADEFLAEAEKLHKSQNHPRGAANDLQDRGDLALCRGELELAENYFAEARNLHEECKSDLGLAYDYAGLAEVALRRGDLETADSLFKQAEELHVSCADNLGLANDLNDRAEISFYRNNFESAVNLLAEAEHLHREIKDDLGLANDRLLRARLAKTGRDFPKAHEFISEAEELYKLVNSSEGSADATSELAALYFDEEKYEESLSVHNLAIRQYSDIGQQCSVINVTPTRIVSQYYLGLIGREKAVALLKKIRTLCLKKEEGLAVMKIDRLLNDVADRRRNSP